MEFAPLGDATRLSSRRCPAPLAENATVAEASTHAVPNALSPVTQAPGLVDEGLADDGWGLALSGGGYRAMLFHVGSLWRLNELGFLPRLARIASVSGGSITNGVLACAWPRLEFRDGVAGAFLREVVLPVRRLAAMTLDWRSVLGGWLTLRPIARVVEQLYDRHLFHGATLQDLPDDSAGSAPRFVFNATSLQTGSLWRFSRAHAGEHRVGRIDNPDFPLARVVAASSAFPPMLSPMPLALRTGAFVAGSGTDLAAPPYTTDAILTDGGVYDNLGIETVWRHHRRVLISDASAITPATAHPSHGWIAQLARAADIESDQVRAVRVHQVKAAFSLPEDDGLAWRRGAYWGIRQDLALEPSMGALDCPIAFTLRLAATPTRLKRMPPHLQEQLINWGYAACDASVRTWVLPDAQPPADFPYPRSGVGAPAD